MRRHTRRLLYFIIAILVGLAVGVIYGWEVNPVRSAGGSPDRLRMDYKTDIVLMAAELYQAEGDSDAAISRLAFVGDAPAADIVEQAIDFAERNNYAPEDVRLLWQLASAVESALSDSE